MVKSTLKKRLPALLEPPTPVAYEDGKWAGRQWARTWASSKELLRWAIYCEGHPGGRKLWWRSGPSGRETFAYAVRPASVKDDVALEAFWRLVLGGDADRTYDWAFLYGFGNGALEVWDEKHGGP